MTAVTPPSRAGLTRLIRLQAWAEAAQVFESLLQTGPADAELWFTGAEIYRHCNQPQAAFQAYLATLRQDPAHARAHYWLSVLLQRHHPLDALLHIQQSLGPDPEDADGRARLVEIYQQLAQQPSALAEQLGHRPEQADTLLNALSMLPAIPQSEAEIACFTDVLEQTVQTLSRLQPALAPRLAGPELAFPQALTYYGLDGERERALRAAYAGLFAGPEPPQRPARRGKPRLAFVSGLGRTEILLRFQAALMRQLPLLRPQAEWLLAAPAGHVDQIAEQLPGWHYLPLPADLPAAAARMAAAGLDLAFYWEYGLDPLSYFLPCYRPAAVQAAGIGWPATSGQPQMDYYVSCAPLEAPGAQRFYTEKLVLQPNLPYPGLLPALPAEVLPRSHWGFSADQRLYLCLQDPLKLHPRMDRAFARILAADGRAQLVLIAYRPDLGRQLQQRLRQSLPQYLERIHLLPRQPPQAYLSLILAADVALDSWPYAGGGGTNTDLLACGTPVVTLPGPQLRHRITASLLQTLGLDELIATSPTDYAERALRVAASQRGRYRRIMRERTPPLLEDRRAAESFADLLLSLLP